MPSLSDALVLCSIAFCGFAEGSESVGGNWKDIANITEGNYWSRNAPIWTKNLQRNDIMVTSLVATYRRSATAKRSKYRVLFVDQASVTWVYSLRTASWTALPEKENKIELSRVQAYFSRRYGSSVTSLCDSRFVAFGGLSETTEGYLVDTNEAWMFDGAVEEWSLVRTLARTPEARHGHETFAFRRNESECRCKDSLFVYGGHKGDRTHLDDLWELRCVDDKNETNMKYEWIKSDVNTTSFPKNLMDNIIQFVRQNPIIIRSDLNGVGLNGIFAYETFLYWTTDYLSRLSIFDTRTGQKSSSVIRRDCSPTYFKVGFAIYNALHLKERHLVIFFISHSGHFSIDGEHDALGVIDLQGSVIHCINVHICKRNLSSYIDDILLSADDKIVILGRDIVNGSVVFWSFETSELFRSIETKSLLKIACHGPSDDNKGTDGRYPLVMRDHRFIRITDSVWYLMQIAYPSDLQMWRFEIDIFRWSLYDPDERPETTRSAIEATTTTTTNNCVAYFGSRYGYNSSGEDDLWIYATSTRTWCRVVSHDEKAPKKLTAYATMSSLDNGSLVLFGGVDNRTSSLWMVTVDYERMTATWEWLCCQDDREQPINKLLRWSSAVWNNNIYVYFGQRTTGECDSTMYFQNLGNAVGWKMKDSRRSCISFCKADETVSGRFAYTTDEIGNLLMADFNRVEYFIAGERKFPKNSKALLVAQNSELFSFTQGPFSLLFDRRSDHYDNVYQLEDSRVRNFRLIGCEAGSFSRQYSVYPCQLCPKGEYSNRYNSTNCTICPSGLITKSTGSNSIKNCTCASGTCVYGECVVQSDLSTLCICYTGFTGKTCESPTMYLVFVGIIFVMLIVIAFYYIVKRVKKHQNVAKYVRVELEIAEQMVEELSNIWSVETDEIKLGRKIGEGSFGDVWTAEYRDQTVAVKVLKIKADDCTNEQLQEFKDESELLRSIFHANIVRLIGTGKTRENKPFIALEYLERGSVRKALDDDYANQPMEIRLQVKYALDAAKGMRHLHRLRRMHRDLKCDNLLIDYKGLVKVADFGCTRIVPKIADDDEDEEESGKIKGSRAVGTALFRAPEIFRGEAYDIAVDVYSYGITLWEIQTAKNPYFERYERGMTAREILDDIVRKDVRPEFPAKCDGDLKALAISCWNGNPYRRPTFEEIVQTLEKIRYEDEVELLPSRNLDYTVTGDQKEANSS